MSRSHFFASPQADKSIPAAHANVRAYLNFDGTLTGCDGSKTIFTELYESLKKDPKRDYIEAEFLDPNEMKQKLQIGLQQQAYATMRLTKGACNFLKEMLALDAQIIVTGRNRREYMKAILAFEGLSADERNKITIFDINNLEYGTYDAVIKFANENTKKRYTIICDNDPSDFEHTKRAVEEASRTTTILSYCKKPGMFKWEDIASELRVQKICDERDELDSPAYSPIYSCL